MKNARCRTSIFGVAALLLCLQIHAQAPTSNLMQIDATAPLASPQPVAASLGTSHNPAGHTLGVNSQYLILDNKPWLPVMGEFHFSRYPEAQWEQEILKMKAAGVQIVSTYVIWIHHEQIKGVFDWRGQRDLHRFVELCGKHGLYVYPRIGPWAHAEVRNGGLPDWVVQASPTRQNDATYLAEVQSFYTEIAKQLNGELWKEGGPVIGIQIENEYRDFGPGKGDDHIRKLKAMAVADGLDVPLYTVTGWDGTAIPLDQVLPVFGGYPDAPWDDSPKALPANEIYAFRFDNRAAGSMGAIGGRGQNASSSYRGTPFLTAEIGDGIEDTYFRRPVVSPDDVASIAPIMLGSGANLLGYYMFHGGRNPDGGTITLQESQRTGYPTDLPEFSYDFQAPLGEYGQESSSLRKLKLIHYFLEDFGSTLAPMTPRRPSRVPSGPSDASVARISARTSGNQGFVFFNNHVRGLAMPARSAFQVELALPSGKVRLPESPIDLPTDSYGIWPVNLPLASATLRYSTAQPFKRIESNGHSNIFFFAIPGIQPEFAVEGVTVRHATGTVQQIPFAAGLKLRVTSTTANIELSNDIHLILLPESEAEDVWKVGDPSLLLETKAYAFSDGHTWTLQSTGSPVIDLGVFGSSEPPHSPIATIEKGGITDLFQRYRITQPPVVLTPTVTPTTTAGVRPPWQLGPSVAWRTNPIALAPEDGDFTKAASWNIAIPPIPLTLSDAFLKIFYEGDVARVYKDGTLLDDNFWNGIPWTLGLRESEETKGETLALSVLPLPKAFPMYIERSSDLHFHGGAAEKLTRVEIVPQYQVVLNEQHP